MEHIKKVHPFYIFYALFFAFLINRLFFFSPGVAEQTMSYLVYPLVKIRSVVKYPFVSLVDHVQSVDKLESQILQLQSEKEQLQEELVRQKSVQSFYEQSAEVVEFGQNHYEQIHKKLVKILQCTISNKEDFLFIDGGKNYKIGRAHV